MSVNRAGPTLAGWVYILASPHGGGIVKIGRTTRNGPDRAAEINRAPGYRSLRPWREVWCKPVADCVRVETAAHRMLSHRRIKIDDLACNELFCVELEGAVAVVEAAAASVAAGGGATRTTRTSTRSAYRPARQRRVARMVRCFALGAALAGFAVYEGLLPPTMAILRGLGVLP